MPIRLILEFPADGDAPNTEPITFVCDSGDYDPGLLLDLAVDQVRRRLATYCDGDLLARLYREDV